jgi:hypothetical protein
MTDQQVRGEEHDMCASCGCGEPDEQHGNSANITQSQIDDAASAADITPEQAARNILDSVQA